MSNYPFSGPAEVRGSYQNFREVLQPVLIMIFIITPWVKINQQPLMLFDVFNRHFVFFGISFFSHDAPLLFFLAILFILGIFVVTALFGRLWCGWTCPQTVFIHGLFNKIEKLILGPYAKRQLLYRSEDAILKKIKIFFYYVISSILCWILAHSFVAYFLGADVVTRYIYDGPSLHLQSFFVLGAMTVVLFLNFVFFREKLCFLICPYGRFQNALIDSNTLVVLYDALRGEPRGKLNKARESGDCVDCHRCVTVCPTKIDIREGFQFECIACGKCIDACNEVMTKIKKPTQLIRYATGDQKKITVKRFRLNLYFLLIILFAGGFIWTINQRSSVDFNVSRSNSNPFSSRIENGKKISQNQILLHLKNQTNKSIQMRISLSEKNIIDGYQILSPALEMQLEPEQDLKIPAFIEIEQNKFSELKRNVQVTLETNDTRLIRTISFVEVE